MRETLGHYKLQRSIGKGAMGEVFLAEDTKLDRRVALKVLPPELAGNPERLARFKREAKAAAAITHPGIVTLYAIEEATDETGQTVHFLTMELVDGKTLSDCIDPDGLPLKTLLDWGVQLADALAGAHAEGIIHRDLKPANIMVTTSDSAASNSADAGRLKILDFGLARPEAPSASDIDNEAPTAAESLTQDGRVLGTPAYMSPEQAEGSPVDHRTDIFSLGILLFELAIGKRPFAGTSSSGVISAILRDEPASLTDLKPEIPVELARIVRRCLQKDRNRRFQTALDVRNELDELRREVDSGIGSASASGAQPSLVSLSGERRQQRPWLSIAGIVVALVVGVVASNWWLTTTGDESRTTTRITTLPGQEMFPNLTRDGKRVVYAHRNAGSWGIYLQRVSGSKPLELTADHDGDDTMPALSPNNELIAFRSERDGGGLYVMGSTGESVRRLSDFGYNPSWAPDSRRLVFATSPTIETSQHSETAELWIIDVVQGKAKRLEGVVGAQPAWSPNGHRIAYYKVRQNRNRDIFTISPEGGDPVAATDDKNDSFCPTWSPDGRHLYFRKGSDGGDRGFARVPIDERTGRVTGDSTTVTQATGGWHYHLSIADSLGAYSVLNQRSTIEVATLKGESGQSPVPPQVLMRDTEDLFVFDCSPDGSTLLGVKGGSNWRLFSMKIDGSSERELATGRVYHPRWSPDGQRIAFDLKTTGNFRIYSMSSDGSDLRALTDDPEGTAGYPVWSPDGRQIVYWRSTDNSVYAIDPALDSTKQQFGELVAGSTGLIPSDWSKDGTTLLAEHSDGGIILFKLASGEQTRLTKSGKQPRWLDEASVVYVANGQLYRLDIESRDVAPLIPMQKPTEIDVGVAVGPGGDTVYYTRYDREYDIWTINLD